MTTEVPLPDWYAALPRKVITAGVLIRDQQGHVLLGKPTYKENWELPGGIVENGESPRAAARREVAEELGLDIVVGRLLVQQWTPPRPGRDDKIQHLYDGGTITTLEEISFRDGELSDVRFFDPHRIDVPAHPFLAARILSGIEALASGVLVETEESAPG